MKGRPRTTILERSLHERPWGRDDLPLAYHASGRRIGEVWHQHPDARLPVLVKSLFTSERLSVQVHPDDDAARALGLASGKEEWWLVTAAAADAVLGIGLKAPVAAETLRNAALDGSIIDLMEWFPVRAGDFFHIPPGTVHAIGAGVDIIEVQQNADITYRIFDYGRGRELHLDAGLALASLKPHPPQLRGKLSDTDSDDEAPLLLTRCPHFTVWHVKASALAALPRGVFQVVPLTGQIVLADRIVSPGQVLWCDPADLAQISSDFTGLVIGDHAPD